MPNTPTAFTFPEAARTTECFNMEILQIIPSGKFTDTLRKYNIFNILRYNLSFLTIETRDAVKVTRMSLPVLIFLEGS